jgi:hypothetical protein
VEPDRSCPARAALATVRAVLISASSFVLLKERDARRFGGHPLPSYDETSFVTLIVPVVLRLAGLLPWLPRLLVGLLVLALLLLALLALPLLLIALLLRLLRVAFFGVIHR